MPLAPLSQCAIRSGAARHGFVLELHGAITLGRRHSPLLPGDCSSPRQSRWRSREHPEWAPRDRSSASAPAEAVATDEFDTLGRST
jgi:hypothetical protein